MTITLQVCRLLATFERTQTTLVWLQLRACLSSWRPNKSTAHPWRLLPSSHQAKEARPNNWNEFQTALDMAACALRAKQTAFEVRISPLRRL